MGPVGGFQGSVATTDVKEGQAYQQAVFPLWRVFYSGRNTPCHRTSLELETLSGESHKEGRLYQAGSFMPRRGMVAKKGDGGMYFFFYHMQQHHILGFQSLCPRNTEILHRVGRQG